MSVIVVQLYRNSLIQPQSYKYTVEKLKTSGKISVHRAIEYEHEMRGR